MGRASEGATQETKTNQNRLTKSCSNRLPAGPLGKKVAHGLGARPGSRLVQVVWCEGVQGGRLDEFHPRTRKFFIRPLVSKSRFCFHLPDQTDRAQASGHPKPCRINQQSPPYLQSSSRSSIMTHGLRSTFSPFDRFGYRKHPSRLSPVESFCTVTPKVKKFNARRITQCMRIDSYACAVF